MKIKRSTLYGLGILILIIGAGLFLTQGKSDAGITGNVVSASGGAVQEVVIGMKNYNYYPNTVTVKAGQPVKLSLDESVYGCFRDFTIRELNVRKYLRTPQDSVTFTPTEKGTYTFACSMGMGTGKLVVK
jgi:plastocyanin domain-containing protein